MLNRKLTPTFTHVFEKHNNQRVTIQFETEFIRPGFYINKLKCVYYQMTDITHFFEDGLCYAIPLWLEDAMDEHADKIWSEKTAEPMQLITERYKTL